MSRRIDELKKAKAEHKESVNSNKRLYIEKRNELVKHILGSHVPNWGSFNLKLNSY